jgi:hypothetical protein
VSVFKQSGTNLLSECIFSNLFALQGCFFARDTAVIHLFYLGAKVVEESIQSGGNF